MVRSGGMVPAGYRITYPPLHFVKDHYQEGLLIGRVNGEQVPLGEFDFRLNQLTRGEWDRATLRDAIFAHRCWASLIKKESA
jgi:hypothetical protein